MSRIALLFPGQGSQRPGMGSSLAEAFPESREAFAEADAALGDAISAVCFTGSAEQLALTENTQPAILTVSIAAWRALAARGVRADAAAGHSLGEYSAHVAAGSLPFADAVRVVRRRGRFMQQAVPVGAGAMAAILGMEASAVASLCREAAGNGVVQPANLNGPGQVVIAGDAAAVDRALVLAAERGAARAVRLDVSAPFHCALMEPAADALRPVLDAAPFVDPRIPVYTNVDAAPATDAASARDGLARQVASPVRWEDLIRAMLADGYDTFIEVGPGKVLGGLMRRIRREARTLSVEDAAGVHAVVDALEVAK